jgi:serine/threonine protein kinase
MRVPDQEYLEIAMKEFNLLEKLGDHSNVVKVYDIYYNDLQEKIYILMEYAGEGSDLMRLIKQADENDHYLKENEILNIMSQLLGGISYIHEKGVCHRDIKPSNIYVTKDLQNLKILDFNVALRFTTG